jgi:sugar phosphate isomerase/epimerase
MPLSRRDFVRAALAACAAAPAALAIDPIRRTGPPKLLLSLAAYSYRAFLAPGKGRGKPTMTLEDFIDLGAKFELPAVELTSYYFAKTDNDYLDSLKARCAKHKLDVSGTAVGNDFCHTDKARLAKEMQLVKDWTERTARLGGKTMRIFAGSVKKGDSEEKARQRAVDHINEACKHAAKHKVTLALENHGGITSTADQLLKIVKAVDSEWFGVNLDTGNFRTADPYAEMAKAAPYAVVCQVKTEVVAKGKRQDADLKRMTDILKKANFQGFVALEYEAKEDPKTAVPKHLKELKKYVG